MNDQQQPNSQPEQLKTRREWAEGLLKQYSPWNNYLKPPGSLLGMLEGHLKEFRKKLWKELQAMSYAEREQWLRDRVKSALQHGADLHEQYKNLSRPELASHVERRLLDLPPP